MNSSYSKSDGNVTLDTLNNGNGICTNNVGETVQLFDSSMKVDDQPCSSNRGEVKQLCDGSLGHEDEASAEDIREHDRGTWSNTVEFFLAIMGYTVGVGSIWRFPITCSRNGGGAFLIPFFFFLITAGGPLYYLEVCLGQFSGKSAGLAFRLCPLLQGLGFLQVTISFLVTWYCLMINSWAVYYFYSSFRAVLPWTTCTNPWNTVNCTESSAYVPVAANVTEDGNTTFPRINHTANIEGKLSTHSASYEFWEYKVIGRSAGLHDMGNLQVHLYVCVLLSWVFIVLSLIKGPKSLGKVVYVTATAPFLLLTVIFIKGLTLEGSMDGIVMFLKPDFTKLFTVQVWLEAAVQVFYSLGPSWGGVITMASYNKFHRKSFGVTAMCVVSCGFSSFYNGLIVFTILGFMAKETGLPIQTVASQSGPGLTFVAFPTALSKMPVPQLWSALFFLTLLTVIFDSQFGALESIMVGLMDGFPKQLGRRRGLITVGAAALFFVTEIPLCFNGGIYIFQLCDWYFSQFALLFGSLFECVAVCWIYGTDRFCYDIKMMTGRDVSVLLRCLWTVIIPVFAIVCFITMLLNYTAPDYGDGYEYSMGALAIGVGCGLLPIAGMIVIGVITLLRRDGTFIQRLRRALVPSDDWYPNDDKAKEEYTINPYRYPSHIIERFLVDICGRRR